MAVSFDQWQYYIRTHVPEPAAGLAIALCLAAVDVGGRIADGERFGIRQGEEGLTESVLMELCRQLPLLEVRKLTHSEEVTEGADWEWWIQGQKKWFGFLVQAKRVSAPERGRRSYDLGYRPSSKGGERRPRQIDALHESSRILGIPAVYALYNEAGTGLRYSRPQYGRECVTPIGGDGITALGVNAARWILDHARARSAKVEMVAPYAFPWSCLTHCVTNAAHSSFPIPPNDLPEALGFEPDTPDSDPAYASCRFLLEIERAARLGQLDTAATNKELELWGYGPDIGRIAGAVRDAPPAYVSQDNEFEEIQPHDLEQAGIAPRYVISSPQPFSRARQSDRQ
ncbi:hypothetical protein [Rhodococcus sp. C3V]|uniref:hypothetical protein n=1 Tax=Rhodococcus sp. C3V TaxID=3034165 RepID=UPI0023E233A3|nr:hypothetical protein [Rhodococcus sp. C3V]MDF3319902.1 hypothetical protein [Rhodococcus sp. C3V]